MDAEILKIVGQVAGIGGIALGVLLFIFRDVVRKKVFPTLTKEQGYKLLRLVLILTWSIAIIGIVAWVFVSLSPANSTSNRTEQSIEIRRSQALLLGYESALTLGKSNFGESIDFELASLSERLSKLNLNNINYPATPTGSNGSGQPAMQFVQKVAAKLNVRDQKLAEAFLLGWHGYIEFNSPGTFPSFNLKKAAERAGFKLAITDEENVAYNLLVESALSR